MAQLMRARVRRTAAMAIAAVVFTAACGSCGRSPDAQAASYCAILSDAIGLYVGNPVTQMGFQIGKVTLITPGMRDVRVDFTLGEHREMPDDVKAVIRSTSILADRSLELVGNYQSGEALSGGECIPVERTATPKTLSEVIGSATDFVNSVNPDGSSNIGDVVQSVDQATRNNGAGINKLITNTSSVLDSPDQAISDIGSIVSNLAELSTTLNDIKGPLKEALVAAEQTTPDIEAAVQGATKIFDALVPLVKLVADLEVNMGGETQQTLDAVSLALRKISPHANRLANLLNPVPWWINTLANHFNDRDWFTLRYRPPMYKIRAPDGLALCNVMNASMPNSCADVAGQPYAVNVALLQYVLAKAQQR